VASPRPSLEPPLDVVHTDRVTSASAGRQRNHERTHSRSISRASEQVEPGGEGRIALLGAVDPDHVGTSEGTGPEASKLNNLHPAQGAVRLCHEGPDPW